jgi:hypothetical protein
MEDEEANIRAEMDKFLADDRTLRFETTDLNFTCLADFLDQHGLEANHRNLLFAFDSLQDVLELIPFRAPFPAEPQPVPAEPIPQSVMPVKARTIMYRNGQPIEGTVKRYGDR